MTAETFSGPAIVAGDLYGLAGVPVPEYNPDAGPGVTFQGDCFPDVRFTLNKDNILPGTVKCHLNYPYNLAVDAVPSALGAANIAAAQNVTNGTAMTLAGASTGIATNIPINQFNTATILTANIALDFGFQTGNCTSGSANITVSDATKFVVGMPLVIANVGNSGGTSALLCIVKSINASTNVITVDNAPQATNAAAPIGTGNWWGNLYGNPGDPTFAMPYVAAGAALMWDPTQGLQRGVRIVGSASATGGHFIVQGYTKYGEPVSENINATSGATTTWGKKTYAYIQSVTPQFTDAHNYSVGTSDVFGVNIRNDKWEYNNWYWAGAFLTASTGWTAADTTSPATQTTGDTRGTLQIGTNGPLGSGASGGASNGSLRLALFGTIPQWNLVNSSLNKGSVSLYGVTPA